MRLSILAFACGIVILQLQGALPELYVLAGLAMFAVAAIALAAWRGQGALRGVSGVTLRAVSLLCWAALGFAWAGLLAQQRLAEQLPEAWEAKDIEMSGVIASLPQRFERGERFVFDVDTTHSADAVVPGRILLSWYHGWDDQDDQNDEAEEPLAARTVRPGERWRFTVRLKRPHGNANPHGFDYEAWLLERNIRAVGSIRTRADRQRLDDFVWRPGYAVERLRDVLRHRFDTALPDAPYLGVLAALAVGDQRAIPNEQWTVFNRTGVTHLVSISGLHITMIAALCAALVNVLWRRSERLMLRLPAQKAALAAGWLAALAYAALAGFEVPAQRTLYMLTAVALALLSGRNFGLSRTLLLALLAVLLLDPWAVLATGFWLSFGAVALLFLVGSAGSAGRADFGKRRGWRATLAQWGLTQWAVTLGSLPLLLLFFQQFSLVSPLANAVAIPFVSFIVTPLALIFAVLPWAPLLQFDHWLLAQLMWLLEWLANYPVWQQAAPPLWAALLAGLGVFWLLLPRGFPARWLGLCLLLPALTGPPPRPLDGEAWVDVLDVGQGLAVVVRTFAHTLLYDSGPMYSAEANAGQRIVVPFLRASGVGRLDTLLVSHRDKDHSGGMASVQEALPVRRLLTSIPDVGGEPCVAGQNWTWDGVHFIVLHPEAADYQKKKKTNSMSCVLRVETAGGSVLLTGDIEEKEELALVARSHAQLLSSVLVVPHHGGGGSSSPPFVAAVDAGEAVFSAGYKNAFRHPRPEILERHAASRTWRTDRDGALRVVLAASAKTPTMTAWRNERRRYWYGQ